MTKVFLRCFMMCLVTVIGTINGMAEMIENNYFSISTPDDSWYMGNDGGALQSIGARARLFRNDASHHIMELGRVDCIDGAFAPAEYLKQQILEGHDVFAKNAHGFSSIADTTMAGFGAKRVHFVKTQQVKQQTNIYHCTAIAFNAGFSTFLIIEAHRSDVANVVGWILGTGMNVKLSATPLETVAQYVTAAGEVLKKHRLPVYGNEYLDRIKLSPDSTTVEMNIIIPYTKAEAIKVPAFVQAMRDHWSKTFKQQVKLNMMFDAIVREQKAMRYLFLDNDLNEIGSLFITPPEYNMLFNR